MRRHVIRKGYIKYLVSAAAAPPLHITQLHQNAYENGISFFSFNQLVQEF